MGGAGVIDNFLGTFTRYIDSGFGLLGGEERRMQRAGRAAGAAAPGLIGIAGTPRLPRTTLRGAAAPPRLRATPVVESGKTMS